MFGVLVVILRPDQIAGLGFGLGQRQISLIVSLRVLRALLLRAAAIIITILCPPPLLAGRK
jgi:hypothetical protein